MRTEIDSAIDFITKLLRRGLKGDHQIETFKRTLDEVLCAHYHQHWFPDKPHKGSAYRCMRIVNQKMDPLIARAGAKVGLSESKLLGMFPSELTMWVDPREVSYRIGEDGSIGVLYDSANVESTNVSDDSDSYSDDSSCSSTFSGTSYPTSAAGYHHNTTTMPPSSESQSRYTGNYMPTACKDEARFGMPTIASPEQLSWDYLATYAVS